METLKALNINIDESLEEQLTHLLVNKDETLAMLKIFEDEELIEKLNEIEKQIKQIKKLLN